MEACSDLSRVGRACRLVECKLRIARHLGKACVPGQGMTRACLRQADARHHQGEEHDPAPSVLQRPASAHHRGTDIVPVMVHRVPVDVPYPRCVRVVDSRAEVPVHVFRPFDAG
jgi:hypothetical protein